LSPEVCPVAPGDGTGPEEWARYERDCSNREADALAKWLQPIPWRLFVTVAPLAPFGAGTYRWLAEQLLDLVAWQTGVSPRELGLVGFTQQNHGRGGLHSHQLVASSEPLMQRAARYRRAGDLSGDVVKPCRPPTVTPSPSRLLVRPAIAMPLHRVSLAHLCEDRWSQLQPQRLDYQVRQAVRVDVQAIRDNAKVVKYSVRYAGREASGDMFEAGRGLAGWSR
jgi:hypothetical protein